MKTLLALLIAVSWTAGAGPVLPSPDDPVVWSTLPNALQQASTESRPSLIYVHAAWCAPCRQLERETFVDTRIQERLSHFAKAELIIDEHDEKHRVGPYRLSEAGWAKRFGADLTPTLIFLDANGAVLARKTGFLDPEGLLPILDAALVATSQRD